MALTSSFHTMSTGSGSSSSNTFLLPKTDISVADNQLIDILLNGQNNEHKIQIVNRWCKNSRRNRLSTILDVSQRHDVLSSLVNTLQQTTNTEYQYNCLTLLSELQTNIHHYDQRIYLPAIIQCFSSTSNDVQLLAGQLIIKQIRITQDIPTFLFLYTQEGLKSSNIKLRIKSIQLLNELLTNTHQYENLSPIFEILLQYLQDNTFRSTYNDILINSIQHIKRILGSDLLNNYLEKYSSSLRRTYNTYILQKHDDELQIINIDTDLDDDDETPRASMQTSQIKDKNIHSNTGTNNVRSHGNNHPDNSHNIFSTRKLPVTSQSSITTPITNENSDFDTIVELIRSKWLSANDTNRLNYLDQFKQACDKSLQLIRSQYLSTTNNSQFHQTLHTFLTTILDLLSYITSSNLDLSIKIKLVLCTCLGWLIKHAQVSYCKRNYKTICIIFKNILLNGQSNNRQLAKLSVSLILLLENFVQPQLILNELIDDNFERYNYRIQLEMLAIITATLLKYRQHNYDNLTKLSKYLLPMLISNRRELRHGAIECFTVICSYFNTYKPITLSIIETNQSIKLVLTLIENLSSDALNALRFRLQRNLLPLLTDEGNITPGLVCDSTTLNDIDAKFILLVNNTISTPQPTTATSVEPPSSTKITPTNKLLQLPMPFAETTTTKTNIDDAVMRNHEIPPLKPSDVDRDLHRFTSTNHRYETPINPTVVTTHTPGGPTLDLTITGNNSYRPLTLTEKVFTDEWAKKLSTNNNHPNEPIITSQQQETNYNNTLQFRPSIPRRPSLSRFPIAHNLLTTSQVHSHQEPQQQIQSKRQFDSEIDHDEGIDSAIESRSLSINTLDDTSVPENDHKQSKKPVRSVHSSSTRRKIDRLFSNGSDIDPTSARTLTPENSNESGVYSQSGREIENDTNGSTKSTQSIGKDQLFSTKPRLARSGSKSKLDKSQLPPTDPSLSSRQTHDYNSNGKNTNRTTNTNVEIIGKNYIDTKMPLKQFSIETIDDKQSTENKSRTKITKASVIHGPLNTTTHTNVNLDNGSNLNDEQDIGIIGKAVNIPLRTRPETDITKIQNTNTMNKNINKPNDNVDMISDEYDSDSKENENFIDMGQSLSASFRLRVQQKTQEKIEQKERRRQDREFRRRQLQLQQYNNINHIDNMYDNDLPTSSTSTSRYSSQPDLSSNGNDLPPTPRRQIDSNITSILPNVLSQQRFRVYKNAMARSQTFNNRHDLSTTDQRIAFNRPLSEDRISDQLRNPDGVYREAMESVSSDDWERKCSGLSLLQRLIAQYPDIITQNLHQVVLVLIQEVKNLRSQVARFALSTFSDMFKHLKRNMDIELDITVKAIMQKSAESNEFFRTDVEKCLQILIENVTLQKALQALIAGGASHRNPAVRKTSAKYIYIVCEKLGPNKILSGARDITERVLQVAATFASDGPPEIRWYGKKIYHMLMSFDELDSLMKHYLNPTVYSNMCEILDNIRAKGGVGETPSESATKNGRRTLSDKIPSNGTLTNHFSSTRKINSADQTEQVRNLTKQMRSSDFRERLNGIEEFQKLCELETETAIQSLVQIFDGFNECLADMNSKVVLKALNTMHQLIPILGDALSNVINSALPIVAQNIASKNRDISQFASDIIDTAIEYIDSGCLLQPLCTLSQNSNLRVRPEIVLKLATLVPRVCQRKPKQVELHLLPTYWKLLALLRGQNTTGIISSGGGSNSLNSSIHILTTALYTELGSVLLDKASSSSMVTPKNLQVLRELCTNIDAV
ncbi:unnamed protein product [Rotaria sordida]|uniref:TOG domain-containing protein n=1 Tax=Rotaria sordida TaxID=392033 RepID=A0A813ZCV7_9BILA|nr:unnamed protein product [Rotaria sordida]CAF3627754.1 unnamed protein product [Rotaria sordida]